MRWGLLVGLSALLGLLLSGKGMSQPVCSAEQFNGRAGVHITASQCRHITGTLRPGNGSTFEGLDLDHVVLDDTTSVTLRNNRIVGRGDGRTVLITGTQRQLRIEGNTIVTTSTHNDHAHTLYVRDAHAEDVVIRGNHLSNTSPGGEDLLQMLGWSGTWTVSQNTFGANPAEDHIDIKASAPGRAARLVLTENLFEGHKLQGLGGCILLHGERLPGTAPYAYTVEVTRNTFRGCRKPVFHRIAHLLSGGDPDGRTLIMTDNAINGGVVVIESNNATLQRNVFGQGATLQLGDNGHIPHNVTTANNTFTAGIAPTMTFGVQAPAPPPQATLPSLPNPRQLWALWDLELGGHLPPAHFVLTVEGERGMTVPPPMQIPYRACIDLHPQVHNAELRGAQHCTPVGCPPQGTYHFWVEAQYAEGLSTRSNIATCTVVAGRCDCQSGALIAARPPALPTLEVTDIPPLSQKIPPLVQVDPPSLNLQPIGAIPVLPIIPPIPAPMHGT